MQVLTAEKDTFQMFSKEWTDPNVDSMLTRISYSIASLDKDKIGNGAAIAKLSQEGDEAAIKDAF